MCWNPSTYEIYQEIFDLDDPMACQTENMNEEELYPVFNSSAYGPQTSLRDRRHGGGIGDDYGNDYGLSPPKPRTTDYSSKQWHGKWLKHQHQQGHKETGKLYTNPTCVHSNETERARNGRLKSFPIEECTESGWNGLTQGNLADEFDTVVPDTDYSDEERSDATEELRATTPQFIKDSAVFKLTHSSGLRNNPTDLLSVDNFSQSLSKPNGLLYKRRGQSVYIPRRDKPVRASTIHTTTGDVRGTNRQAGFEMKKCYPQPLVQDKCVSDLQKIVPGSKTTHNHSFNSVKPILKSNMDLNSHHGDEFYSRFARRPRRADASVKLPPISAPSQISTLRKERRRTHKDVRSQLKFSEECRSEVKALGD